MALRGTYVNFQFFNVIEPQAMNVVAAGVTGDSVDTKGFETVMFNLHVTNMSLGSIADQLHVTMEHASNSTTGPNAIGAWSAVSGIHVYGLDKAWVQSDFLLASWLLLDELTRTSYPISVQPAWHNSANSISGRVMYIGLPVASTASAGSQCYQVGYRGRHRWVRLTISGSGNASLGAVAATAMCGLPADWPVLDYGHPLSHG